MSIKNADLHGSAPDKSDVAMLLIDVINDLDFPGAAQLLKSALPMARQIAALKERANVTTFRSSTSATILAAGGPTSMPKWITAFMIGCAGGRLSRACDPMKTITSF